MLSRKSRKGIRFVIADMLYRSGAIDRLQAGQGHGVPRSVLEPPVSRRRPVFRLRKRPAIGKPKRRSGISSGINKLDPLGVRDEVAGDPHARNQFVMERLFIVETKSLFTVTDGVNTGRYFDIAAWPLRR